MPTPSRTLMFVSIAAPLFLASLAPAQEDPLQPSDPAPQTPQTPASPPHAPPTAPPPAISDNSARPATADPARELFERAVETLKRAQSITYRARTYATGDLFVSTGRVIEAQVRQARQPGGILPGWRQRITGTITAAGGNPPIDQIDIAWLIINVEWVDHANRRVIEKAFSEAKRGRPYTITNAVRIDDLTAYRPFQDELAATSYTLEEITTVGGVECQSILVHTGNGRLKARWHLSLEDHLPRKIEKLFQSSRGPASTVVEISDLRIDESPPTEALMALLRVKVPEGYAQDRPPVPVPVPGGMNAPPGAGDGGGKKGGETKEEMLARGREAPAKQPIQEEKPEETPVEPPPPAPPEPTGPPPAPSFDLTSSTGEKVTLDSLRGRIVILEFAGSWAVNRKAARTELSLLATEVKARPVALWSIAVREKSRDAALEGMESLPEGMGLLLNGDETAVAFGSIAFPSYAVVGPDGELLLAPRAFKPEATMREVAEVVNAAIATLPPESR